MYKKCQICRIAENAKEWCEKSIGISVENDIDAHFGFTESPSPMLFMEDSSEYKVKIRDGSVFYFSSPANGYYYYNNDKKRLYKNTIVLQIPNVV